MSENEVLRALDIAYEEIRQQDLRTDDRTDAHDYFFSDLARATYRSMNHELIVNRCATLSSGKRKQALNKLLSWRGELNRAMQGGAYSHVDKILSRASLLWVHGILLYYRHRLEHLLQPLGWLTAATAPHSSHPASSEYPCPPSPFLTDQPLSLTNAQLRELLTSAEERVGKKEVAESPILLDALALLAECWQIFQICGPLSSALGIALPAGGATTYGALSTKSKMDATIISVFHGDEWLAVFLTLHLFCNRHRRDHFLAAAAVSAGEGRAAVPPEATSRVAAGALYHGGTVLQSLFLLLVGGETMNFVQLTELRDLVQEVYPTARYHEELPGQIEGGDTSLAPGSPAWQLLQYLTLAPPACLALCATSVDNNADDGSGSGSAVAVRQLGQVGRMLVLRTLFQRPTDVYLDTLEAVAANDALPQLLGAVLPLLLRDALLPPAAADATAEEAAAAPDAGRVTAAKTAAAAAGAHALAALRALAGTMECVVYKHYGRLPRFWKSFCCGVHTTSEVRAGAHAFVTAMGPALRQVFIATLRDLRDQRGEEALTTAPEDFVPLLVRLIAAGELYRDLTAESAAGATPACLAQCGPLFCTELGAALEDVFPGAGVTALSDSLNMMLHDYMLGQLVEQRVPPGGGVGAGAGAGGPGGAGGGGPRRAPPPGQPRPPQPLQLRTEGELHAALMLVAAVSQYDIFLVDYAEGLRTRLLYRPRPGAKSWEHALEEQRAREAALLQRLRAVRPQDAAHLAPAEATIRAFHLSSSSPPPQPRGGPAVTVCTVGQRFYPKRAAAGAGADAAAAAHVPYYADLARPPGLEPALSAYGDEWAARNQQKELRWGGADSACVSLQLHLPGDGGAPRAVTVHCTMLVAQVLQELIAAGVAGLRVSALAARAGLQPLPLWRELRSCIRDGVLVFAGGTGNPRADEEADCPLRIGEATPRLRPQVFYWPPPKRLARRSPEEAEAIRKKRQDTVRARVIKTMKKERSMLQSALFEAVRRGITQFTVEGPLFKREIEQLIEGDYVQRDEQQRDMLHYRS